jgi:hypothetical protein
VITDRISAPISSDSKGSSEVYSKIRPLRTSSNKMDATVERHVEPSGARFLPLGISLVAGLMPPSYK